MDVTGEVGTSAINEQQVHEFLSSLFAEDLHAKRVLSLSLATLGVIHAASLSVYAIGQAVAVARGTKGKHGVKQVDRLLSNAGLNVWHLLSLWVPYVLAQRTEVVIALDWTDFDDDDHTTLVASLLTKHGRPTPLVWLTVHKFLPARPLRRGACGDAGARARACDRGAAPRVGAGVSWVLLLIGEEVISRRRARAAASAAPA